MIGDQIAVSGGFKMWMVQRDNQICRALSSGLEWEPHTTSIIRQHLSPGDTFVDCGANIGWHSIVASKLVGPEGKVYAFEPWKDNFDVLVLNLQANGCSNVKAEMVPLWSIPTKLFLWANDSSNIGDVRTRLPAFPSEEAQAVMATTLDKRFRPNTVSFVKIDCQQSDHEVLLGGKRLFTESEKIGLIVEEPRGIPENHLGMRKVCATDDFNYYYERPGN